MFSIGKKARRSAPLLAALMLLGACTTSGGDTAPAVQAPAPEAVAPTPVVEDVPPPPPADPARLMGKTPSDVVQLMGEPGLKRLDGSVQIMLFENRACVFEVVFREPNPDAYFEVTHITARTRAGMNEDPQVCLGKILPNGVWPDGQ